MHGRSEISQSVRMDSTAKPKPIFNLYTDLGSNSSNDCKPGNT